MISLHTPECSLCFISLQKMLCTYHNLMINRRKMNKYNTWTRTIAILIMYCCFHFLHQVTVYPAEAPGFKSHFKILLFLCFSD